MKLTANPILVTLTQTILHLLVAGIAAMMFQSPLSVLASYFLVQTMRYMLAINTFSYNYAKDPEAVEKILRQSFKKVTQGE
jgi:hypothetical protein